VQLLHVKMCPGLRSIMQHMIRVQGHMTLLEHQSMSQDQLSTLAQLCRELSG
jgi:hypothetical protein